MLLFFLFILSIPIGTGIFAYRLVFNEKNKIPNAVVMSILAIVTLILSIVFESHEGPLIRLCISVILFVTFLVIAIKYFLVENKTAKLKMYASSIALPLLLSSLMLFFSEGLFPF